MSAQAFALTSPSLTDMSDAINLAEARARFHDAELRGPAALADWARMYAPPLLDRAEDAPSEDVVEDAVKEAREEAAKDHARDIQELSEGLGGAFTSLATLRKKLRKIAERSEAA